MSEKEVNALVEQLRGIFASKGYVFFERGDFNLNIIGVREDDRFDNAYSDTLLVVYKEQAKWQVMRMPWTTMPGTFGGVLSPITVYGITGTAVLKEGQYRGAYQFIDNWHNFHRSPCFWQVKPVVVYRDGNRDFEFDRSMPQQEGLFGINLHRMEGKMVNNWSLGCQGTNWSHFSKLVDLVRRAAKLYGNRLTYTLLHRKDFAEVVRKSNKSDTRTI